MAGRKEQKETIKNKIMEFLKENSEIIPSEIWLEDATDIFYNWKRRNHVLSSNITFQLIEIYDKVLQVSNMMLLSADGKDGIAIREIKKVKPIFFDEKTYYIEGKILARQEAYID